MGFIELLVHAAQGFIQKFVSGGGGGGGRGVENIGDRFK